MALLPAGTNKVAVEKWPLWRGGCQKRFNCITVNNKYKLDTLWKLATFLMYTVYNFCINIFWKEWQLYVYVFIEFYL